MKTFCLAVMLLAACREDHDHAKTAAPTPDSELVVVPRSHQIPQGHAAEVQKLFDANVLSFPISVVSSAGTNTQFVNPKPAYIGGDHFVIGATPAIHDELDHLLAAMAKQAAPPAAVTYAVTYWAVEADPSTAAEIPADLAEIKPVLDSLGALGPRRFKTIDRAATRSLDGMRAEVKSNQLVVEQTLSAEGEALELALGLQLRASSGQSSEINSKLQVALDKPIVLGETTAAAGSNTAPEGLILFVVRAQRAE